MVAFTRKALDLALGWPKHDERTLGDLVERLDGICDQDQSSVWELIESWSRDETTDDQAMAVLRERIRCFAFTRRGQLRNLRAATRDKARDMYERLAPRDPIIQHAWLFANHWIQGSVDEVEDGDLDMEKRAARIDELRTEAMAEIWSTRGLDGAVGLLADSDAAGVIGRHAASHAKEHAAATEVLQACLSGMTVPEHNIEGFMAGFIAHLDELTRATVLLAVADGVVAEQAARLFRCAPLGDRTWRLLDEQPQEVRDQYWREVPVWRWAKFTEMEWIELIDRLLEARRPRAAFQASAMHWKQIESSRLKRILVDIAQAGADQEADLQLDRYDISAALASLDGRTDVTSDEMVRLEFAFINALEHSEHGIPNLERKIAESPEIFVQAVAVAYKRKDGGQDSPERHFEDPAQRDALAMSARRLLDGIRRIPGTDGGGDIQPEPLRRWVAEVRRICAECGRGDIGDYLIGQLLSRAPADDNGLWPCRPVCEATENVVSRSMADGFLIGTRNARGASPRVVDEGGGQERELAAQYRSRAEQLRAVGYPFVSTILDRIGDSCEEDATRWDTDAKVKQRLHV